MKRAIGLEHLTLLSNSGQSCISVQRVYVQRELSEEFARALADEVGNLRVGDPLDDTTDDGSMVDEEAAERVVRWTAEASAAGGRVLLGGTRDGATMHPTVVADPPATASIVVHEVFGALVAVMPYDTFDEVIEACNASSYGLQAGLFTRDIDRIITAWRELQVGGLVVNGSSNFRLDHVPFGAIPMAVEQGLPVIFVVMNNRAHGTIADLQAANFGTSFGCAFRSPDGLPCSPDFAAMARSCGADGYAISAPDDLRGALGEALRRRRPAVLDVPMVNEPVPTPGHWNITDIYHGQFDLP